MLPRSLVIAILIGVLAGGIFGAFFVNLKDFNHLEFVEGPSLSIITLKTDYELGEEIEIKIINSGTEELTFSDASYGLKITGLDGRELYSPISAQVISKLEPKQEMIFLQSKGLSRVFSNTTVQKHQFFSTQFSLWSNFLDFVISFLYKSLKHLVRNLENTGKPRKTSNGVIIKIFR